MDLKCLLVPLIVVIAASAPGLIAAQPCAVECYPHSTVPVCRPPVAPRSACCAKSPLYPPPPPLVAPIIEPPRPLVWSCAPVPPPPGYAPMLPAPGVCADDPAGENQRGKGAFSPAGRREAIFSDPITEFHLNCSKGFPERPFRGGLSRKRLLEDEDLLNGRDCLFRGINELKEVQVRGVDHLAFLKHFPPFLIQKMRSSQ